VCESNPIRSLPCSGLPSLRPLPHSFCPLRLSVPDEARQKAVEKAEAGEEITFATAKEIVAEAKKGKRPRRRRTISADKLAGRLINVLERYRDRWDPKELAELARQLRELADLLNDLKGGKKTKKD
jgi:hypothetical protein